ncbi:sigma factor-like helix-turn-helix DNA-binding protein [Paenibacillus zeirhizosphaerae]|uniref:sigma factor-like helix-turn-helix DNA-binding protein n=1 Tax=Paenibacillus zeirhizosphaerae TaxID=2987519 RepID=UPI0035202532
MICSGLEPLTPTLSKAMGHALSDRERTCFLLHMAQGLTMQEISSKLVLSRRSVQVYITRAKDKI